MHKEEQKCNYNVSNSDSIASHICVRHGHVSSIAVINTDATVCHDLRPTEQTKSTSQRHSNSNSRKIRARVDVLIEDLLVL